MATEQQKNQIHEKKQQNWTQTSESSPQGAITSESETMNSTTTASTTPTRESDVRHSRSYKDPRRELHPSTAVIMAGYRSDLSESAIKPPVFRSSTFEFTSAAAGELFFQRAYHLTGDDGEKPGLIYSRLNNPNTEILEDKMVALEKGSNYCSAFPSGMSAISTSIMALTEPGNHIVYVSGLCAIFDTSSLSGILTCFPAFPKVNPCVWRNIFLSQEHVPNSSRRFNRSGGYQ